MALSTLKVNRITSRALITKIQIDNDLDLNGNKILNVSELTSGKLIAPAATTLEAGLMGTADKTKLDNIEANADVTTATNVEDAGAIMDDDFTGDSSITTGYLKKTGVNATTSDPEYALNPTVVDDDFIDGKIGILRSDGTQISFDNNTYLTTNEPIAVTGHVEGTGSSSLSLTLTTSAITGQTPYTTVNGSDDRLLVAVRRADGTYVLGQVAPSAVGGGGGSGGGGSVGSFNSGQGINRIAGETGTAVTLQPNQFLIQNQPLVKGDGSNPAMLGDDEVLLNRPSIGMLAKTTLNHLGTWVVNTFGGGGGGGGGGGSVNVTGLAIEFDIDGDGNLTLTHTGGLTSNEIYINNQSELVAVVT